MPVHLPKLAALIGELERGLKRAILKALEPLALDGEAMMVKAMAKLKAVQKISLKMVEVGVLSLDFLQTLNLGCSLW
jgi:hypothetical protein